MLIAHFAVPLVGAVLVAVNTRLAPDEVRYIIDHSGAKMLVGETELLAPLAGVIGDLPQLTEVVSVDRSEARTGYATTPYRRFLARGSDDPLPWTVDDEERTISINYTSGTTAARKASCTPIGAPT